MSEARERIEILICDDSPAFRQSMRWFIEHDADLCVADAVGSGEEAVERFSRLRVDLVLMDLELPGMDGVEAVRKIMSRRRVPILMLGAQTRRGSVEAARAMAAGAIDARPKTDISLDEPMNARSVAFRRYLKRLAYARVSGRRPVAHRGVPEPGVPSAASAIAIAASTGGPRALEQVLRSLPADFAVPVLVVQHIASGFLEGLVTWLDGAVPLAVGLARDGARLERGVWFAPEEAHLVVQQDRSLQFDRATIAGWHRPSADVLFTSMAASIGRAAVGVVLTGMGADAADGVAAIRASDGFVIAQDEESSAVYGMPRAAAEAGADIVLPLQRIGPALAGLRRHAAT